MQPNIQHQPALAPVADLAARREARTQRLDLETRFLTACDTADAAERRLSAAGPGRQATSPSWEWFRAEIASRCNVTPETADTALLRRAALSAAPEPVRSSHLRAVPEAEPELEAEP